MKLDPSGQQAEQVKVVLVEPNGMLRGALRHVLHSIEDIELVGEAGSLVDGLNLIRSFRPGPETVVVVGMESAARAEAFQMIGVVRREFPNTSILVTANRGDSETISRALLFGADSFVPQTEGVTALLGAIRRTASGEMVVNRSDRSSDPMSAVPDPQLTNREIEVLRIAAQGLTARQIARQLGVRERTATTHLSNIYRKLGVSTRMAAVAEATQLGILEGWSPGRASALEGNLHLVRRPSTGRASATR